MPPADRSVASSHRPPVVALVTCPEGRPRDDDLPPLLEAFRALGVDAATPDWDDASIDWSRFDVALIRSTWDYTLRHEEFLAWTRRAAASTRLLNPPEVVAWNSDKRYLADLDALGVPVVATTYPDDAGAAVLPDDCDVVVKPTVSAGSRDTMRYAPDDHGRARRHVADLLAAGRTAMVQPYQRAVDAEGETACLYFGGRFSHAINKGPLLVAGAEATRALFAPEKIRAVEPSDEVRSVADACLGALADVPALAGVDLPLTYARVDVLTADDGRPVVLELELTEPSVFLDFADADAASRFAAAVIERVPGRRA